MTTRTLFDTSDLGKPPPIQTPHNGTLTSRIAAKQAETFAGAQQAAVLAALEQAGEHGMTDQEVETALCLSGNSVRPRRSSLVQLGCVKNSGHLRLTKSGRAAVVWVAVPPDQRQPVASKGDWPTKGKTNPNKNDYEPGEWALDFAI